MKKDPNRAMMFMNILRAVMIVLLSLGIIWYFASGKEFSVEAILNYTPDSYIAAALFMVLLYIVKTLLVFPPIMVLQIAVGLYFPTAVAILINIIGIAVEFTVGYGIGKFIGFNATDKLFKKYPKVRDMVESDKNRLFISYILRALNMLPMDVVSMYLGTAGFKFSIYIVGSVLGSLFGIVAATVIGMSLTDPTSVAFIAACAASLTLSALSCLIYYILTHKKTKKDNS